jgi:glutamate synthase domain-containing protein 3
MAEIDAAFLTTREINQEIRRLASGGTTHITVLNPDARHNLAVAVLEPVKVTIAGSAGYYAAGLNGGGTIEIEGSAGWGLAESMMSGLVEVKGSAGSGAGAALRGGTVVIHGDAAARLGVSMKGGEIIVAGDCGYMAGFMGQKGTLVVCGNTGDAFADSMYATVCYVGGKIGGLGTDTVIGAMDDDERSRLDELLTANLGADHPPASQFQKVVSGRKLWNFDKREWRIWQEAL